MNYPVWELTSAGGGLLIALIAVFHVYIAHFAVGGGLFLVLTEIKGYRENSTAILEYTRRHAWFFMLLTMVAGGITGVGIWFTISLLHPSATSLLIHQFVFGWASEWVFFFCEILALFIYYYTFGRMERRQHLTIGWLYFLFAWLSLLLVNGIIAFMLTPGQWLETKNFWDGFFNPSFWPSLFFRTFLAMVFAGIFGLVTAVFHREKTVRQQLVRYCALWMVIPFLLVFLSAWWYFTAIGPGPRAMILGKNPEILLFAKGFIVISAVLFLGGLAAAVRTPESMGKPLALVMMVIGLLYMGSFEWVREAGRRPYIVYDHMYSNAIHPGQKETINDRGILETARWVKQRKITPANEGDAGRRIFYLECSACHAINGPSNDILPLTKKFSRFGMDAMLDGLGKINQYMPPFMGTRQERAALAAYIVEELHNKPAPEETVPTDELLPVEVPRFDSKEDPYVLLAWNRFGMHFVSDSDAFWSLSPPGTTLSAQLIQRGWLPEIVTQGVDVSYRVQKGFETPSRSVDFWDHAEELLERNRPLPPDTGISGSGMQGTMDFRQTANSFEASLVPVTPYPADKTFNPYPVFTITARDETSGEILARTRMTATVSTEMGCRNCHGGQWKRGDRAGVADETAEDVLAVHDRINKTTLAADAAKGQPRLCQSCHADPLFDKKGKPGLLNLSAAIHGFHANFLTNRDEAACHACHPAGKTGATDGLRGVHAGVDLTCINCHGTLEDHALGLLKQEKANNKKGADRLMEHLTPRTAATIDDVVPRTPWFQEPDCLSCHVDFEPPETDSAYNRWTDGAEGLFRMRTGDGGVRCQACHGAPHAIYPAANRYNR
ncbi:MAG TPA: cytochrome ubiquinol oxidase subunit I, partial [Desulfobacteraceae bacterium]|nr:cytochrome ubiquinol oxidase subunit I [Desulfobacteraceae bacterium]